MKGSASRTAIALLLSFATASATAAGESVDSQRIRLSDAIQLVLSRDHDVKQAQNTVAQSDVDVKESRLQFAPDLRLQALGTRTSGPTFNEAEGRVVNDSTESVDAGITSGITLFNGFHDVAALRKAQFDKSADEHRLDRSRETAVFNVIAQFLALMQQREQSNVQQSNLQSEMTLEQQVQQFVTAGALPTSELYQQQAIVANARLMGLEASRAMQIAQVDLLETLVLEPSGTYEFEMPDPRAFGDAPQTPDLNELLARCARQRADVLAEQAQVDATSQDIRVAKSGYWPTLSLQAGYFSGYTDAAAGSFNQQIDQRASNSVGLIVSIPLFDRNATRYASQRATLRERSALITLRDRQQQAALQVRRAYIDVQTAREQLRIAEEQERTAERAMSASQRRFQAGATTLIELTQARARYVGAQSALVNARTNILFQRSLLDYYTGDLLQSPILSAR